ncbi:MAG TPA: hypothetical protein VMW91_02260 [Desulfosporosinus sp.]|nr:hypothetical protein [Desulfosporosinus sp.]
MNDYDLSCSVSHHFKNQAVLTNKEYEEQEKQRLLTIPKHKRQLWCWVCGFMLDPCDYPTPKGGVETFERHLKTCVDGWRYES